MNLRKAGSFILIFCIFIFLGSSILKQWEIIKSLSWQLHPISLAWLIIFLVPIFFINSLSWHILTIALGSKITFKENFRIWMVSNASRFLPGGFWQYPGRIYMFHKKGGTKTLGTSAVLIEALLNLSIGSLVVFLGSFFVHFPYNLSIFRWLIFAIFLIPWLVLISTELSFFRIVLSYLEKFSKYLGQLKRVSISFNQLLLISCLFFLQYFFSGLSLFFIARAILDLPLYLIPDFIVFFTASWLVGYLVVFAPGGLGVQEISIATLLSFYMPFSIAGLVAVLFRVALYLTEFVTLAVSLNLSRIFGNDQK